MGLSILSMPQRQVQACGCVSPPDVAAGGNQVAQSGEHILFEVGEGTITAHVLIEYSGSPEKFAWLVPVPSVPEFGITPPLLFRLIDNSSAPTLVQEVAENLCPAAEFECAKHPECPTTTTSWTDSTTWDSTGTADTTATPDIEIELEEQVGDYEVVVFRAEEASASVTWLKANGFVVNDSMAPYMQPYLDAHMSFVAVKLLPQAGVSSIKPLRMTYVAEQPMIPLQLTAVAAEPHMPVTTYISAKNAYVPRDFALVELDQDELGLGRSGTNYPSLVSRTLDRVGGAGFILESARPLLPVTDGTGCCSSAWDWCGIENDLRCQCPLSELDASDCADFPEIVEAYEIYQRMVGEGLTLSRLLTRLSPEEMTFDPVFVPDASIANTQLRVAGHTYNLNGCEHRIAPSSEDEFAALRAQQGCADLYCGEGSCATTGNGLGCGCDGGAVARAYVDYDRQTSVTCVPATNLVDPSLDSQVPDPCLGVSCGSGACVAVNGYPTCACDAGHAAVVVPKTNQITCVAAYSFVPNAGGQDLSDGYRDISVCRSNAPECGSGGWLVANTDADNIGVVCEGWVAPSAEDFVIPPLPECLQDGTTSGGTTTLTTLSMTFSDSTSTSSQSSGVASNMEVNENDGGDAGCATTRLREGWMLAMAISMCGILGLRRRQDDNR
jgi:hypothetical protein